MARMPYEISLERDHETGLDRYVVVLGEGFGRHDSRELSDWLLAASQNPTAKFAVDTSNAGEIDGQLRTALSVVGAEDLSGLGHAQA
jgi:hypothetical protein